MLDSGIKDRTKRFMQSFDMCEYRRIIVQSTFETSLLTKVFPNSVGTLSIISEFLVYQGYVSNYHDLHVA